MLLQSSYNYIERGMQTILFAPKIDDRFGGATIFSRIGIKQKAISYDDEFDFIDFIEKNRGDRLKCILVDEVHFLKKKHIIQLVKIAVELDIAVLTYGLRTDFLGEPFQGSKYLLAWADKLVEVKTICHCGKKATMNSRIDANGGYFKEGNQVLVGGNESYTSMCMKHFMEEVGLNARTKTYAE